MEFLFYVLSSLLSLLCTKSGGRVDAFDTARLQARDDALFHHKAFHMSIVVGNYLYIDGGEITTWNGKGSGLQTTNPQSPGNIWTVPDNNTYSIDLSTSWQNSSVALTRTPKTAPILNTGALWPDASDKTFYAYDGSIGQALSNWDDFSRPKNALWRFSPSGNSGEWSKVDIDPSSNFSRLSRVTMANYAYGNDLGFALGGVENYATSEAVGLVTLPVPGLVMFNSSSQQWYNLSSTSSYNYFGLAGNGVAQFVPTFGEAGILVTFGGWNTPNQQLVPLQYASLYDPIRQEWQNQITTGEVPGQSTDGCMVGIEGDDGTYEIFYYGGRVNGVSAQTISNGAVWVLSLPSFHWTKQDVTPSFGRYQHSCNVAGNRQMIVVGGVVITPADNETGFIGGSPDPWDQGLAVFDLTDMEWKSSYDADAPAYVTPKTVKQHNAKHKYPAEWTSESTEAWFSANGTSEDGKNKSSSNTGAIAGGVTGGVAVAAIAGGIWYFLTRRRRKARQQEDSYDQYEKDGKTASVPLVEADGEGHQHEMEGSRPMAELNARDKPIEAPTSPIERYELETPEHRFGRPS